MIIVVGIGFIVALIVYAVASRSRRRRARRDVIPDDDWIARWRPRRRGRPW